jgi:hypothetical protein
MHWRLFAKHVLALMVFPISLLTNLPGVLVHALSKT